MAIPNLTSRYGEGDSTLNVIKKGFKNLNNGSVIWSQNSTKDESWHPMAVSLPFESSSPNFVLIFEGIVGASVYGDIALDDIVVSNNTVCKTPDESCTFTCKNGQCLSADKVCNFVADCAVGEEEEACGYNHVTFENDTKGWTAEVDGLLKWQRKQSGLDVYEPDRDHTIGTNEGKLWQVHVCLFKKTLSSMNLSAKKAITCKWPAIADWSIRTRS